MDEDRNLKQKNRRTSISSKKSTEKNRRDSSDLSLFSRRSSKKSDTGYIPDSQDSTTSGFSVGFSRPLCLQPSKEPGVCYPYKHANRRKAKRESRDCRTENVATIASKEKKKIILGEELSKERFNLTGTVEMRVVAIPEIMRFMIECLEAVELDKEHARLVSDTLTMGDTYKESANGLLTLEGYVHGITRKKFKADSLPVVLKENDVTAWINGNNSLGPIIGNFCMSTAIKKATKSGIGVVIVNNSNYIGNPSYYSHVAAAQGMIGLTFTNTPPVMCSPRGKKAVLGSNPLSFGAPGKDEFLIFNSSNLVTSIDKLREFEQEMESIPANWALDRGGSVTTDAESALEGHCLLPLGGLEDTGGYKGYGMSIMGEVLCSILGDSPHAPNIEGSKDDYSKVSKSLGQCFIAINPNAFAPNGFEDRTSSLMENLRKCAPTDKKKPVLVPGDIEHNNRRKIKKQGGIYYDQLNINAANLLTKALHVHPLHFKDLK